MGINKPGWEIILKEQIHLFFSLSLLDRCFLVQPFLGTEQFEVSKDENM